MASAEIEQKKELARLYYMGGDTQKCIAQKVGVSEQAICRWVKDGAWEMKRAGANVTRTELVNKSLLFVNNLLDRVNSEEIDLSNIGKVVDQISKVATSIQKLDKKATIVDVIEVFKAFGGYMQDRMKYDDDVTLERIKWLNKYHDLFIDEQMRLK